MDGWMVAEKRKAEKKGERDEVERTTDDLARKGRCLRS